VSKGGVVLRVGERKAFIPASVALRVAQLPQLARVAGAPPELLGVALYEGAVLPVIAIGEARDRMVVCEHHGELLGLVGGVVLRSGIVAEEEASDALDIAGLYARIQTGGWMARWGA
jgi:chemotaxis signal transduction protein